MSAAFDTTGFIEATATYQSGPMLVHLSLIDWGAHFTLTVRRGGYECVTATGPRGNMIRLFNTYVRMKGGSFDS